MSSTWNGLDLDLIHYDDPGRDVISALTRTAEPMLVLSLADRAEMTGEQLEKVRARARQLASSVRQARRGASGVDALMHEFSLSSAEGVALMCLAEALLRVPDPATRDQLIADKIGQADWAAHVGQSPSMFVNAAAWGLMLTGRLLPEHEAGGLAPALTGLLRRGGAPVVRRAADLAVRLLGRQFVTGQTIADALNHAPAREARGYRFSYDMLGEAAVTAADADRYFRSYAAAIGAIGIQSAGRGVIGGPGISVKLSALHPRYSRAQRRRVMEELLPRVKALLQLARAHDIGFNIDAEETERLDLSLDILEALARDPAFSGWNGIGFVVQAYQKRAHAVIEWIADLGAKTGHRIMVRLVKGAYWDSEIKAAQVAGLADYPVFTRKAHTDVCYVACARTMLAHPAAIYPQFATHNALTIATIEALVVDAKPGRGDHEFQCLHGMGEAVYDSVVGPGVPVRIYAPVGSHETLLAYLVRRLLENGANTSFVNQIVDPAVDLEKLVEDPVTRVRADGGRPHPAIPSPPDLLPGRTNSAGLDLASETVLIGLDAGLRATPLHYAAAPLIVGLAEIGASAEQVLNPCDPADVVGDVRNATPAMVARAVADASSTQNLTERAAALEAWADALESNRDQLFALLLREAGKTLANAVGELREAVDFCRFYAATARAELHNAVPIGPVVCISPWNFPLAIFTGQIAAAFAAGNPVLAKPAEQTPLIAYLAVTLAHAAGIPRAALQLLPGPGDAIGAALVADPRIQGVMFTGSTAVARLIQRSLATRDGNPVLIAETGGLNAMIVDSTAQPEQVVGDVMVSAFDSAGQRCSALRILCLQEDVADHILEMLRGAMAEMRIGNPSRLSTDVGPVIDAEARDRLTEYCAAHDESVHCNGPGFFVPPTLLEIHADALPREEQFGPVLHVLRWRHGNLPALIAQLNATGYGLTHGVHSRIDSTVQLVCDTMRAGNIYVNRNMIGAVVGVQPFGGEGLSGTGPKAGGPLILHRLVRGSHPGLFRSTDLPGPTGERNVLSLHPVGRVFRHASSRETLASQTDAIAAAGCGLANDLTQSDAVLTDATGATLHALRETLAVSDGKIIPVIGPDDDGTWPIWRLQIERSVSTNTAAAGGNAALMSLPDALR